MALSKREASEGLFVEGFRSLFSVVVRRQTVNRRERARVVLWFLIEPSSKVNTSTKVHLKRTSLIDNAREIKGPRFNGYKALIRVRANLN